MTGAAITYLNETEMEAAVESASTLGSGTRVIAQDIVHAGSLRAACPGRCRPSTIIQR